MLVLGNRLKVLYYLVQGLDFSLGHRRLLNTLQFQFHVAGVGNGPAFEFLHDSSLHEQFLILGSVVGLSRGCKRSNSGSETPVNQLQVEVGHTN